ncbi:MAG: hypothetical protein RL563_1726 [Pseudomonadota bacterium]
MNLSLTHAQPADAGTITTLVNAAYRGESSRQGWTTEADLLDGLRTSTEAITSLLNQDDKLILIAKADETLLGTILMLRSDPQVELSLFAVNPRYQNQGIGKQLLTFAEETAIQHWAVQQAIMAVIPCRSELIAFYQRRGYRLTGQNKPFPTNPVLWTPKVDSLSLTLLVKDLAAKDL